LLTGVLKSSTFSRRFSLLLFFPQGLAGIGHVLLQPAYIGAIAGYSGTFGDDGNRRSFLLGALFFMLGTTSAFAALGAVSGLSAKLRQITLASIGSFSQGYHGSIWTGHSKTFFPSI